jgi:hypothetical protein
MFTIAGMYFSPLTADTRISTALSALGVLASIYQKSKIKLSDIDGLIVSTMHLYSEQGDRSFGETELLELVNQRLKEQNRTQIALGDLQISTNRLMLIKSLVCLKNGAIISWQLNERVQYDFFK